jgi:hypothetical protein
MAFWSASKIGDLSKERSAGLLLKETVQGIDGFPRQTTVCRGIF